MGPGRAPSLDLGDLTSVSLAFVQPKLHQPKDLGFLYLQLKYNELVLKVPKRIIQLIHAAIHWT